MYTFVKYEDSNSKIWDDFVRDLSVNGTFLHSRNFLSYHPKERFTDNSLMIYDEKNHLIAVCPACVIEDNGKKIFFSHKGSTFGGLIISAKYYSAKYVMPMVEEFESYLRSEGFNEVYIKTTADIFCKSGSALLEYAFYQHKWTEYKDLNTYLDYSTYKEDIASNFTQGKRTHVHKCEKEGLITRPITDDKEVADYYEILKENLSKYDLKPVHSLEELLDFKNSRLKKEVEFFGTFLDDVMVSGGMMFYFKEANVAHTQYLSSRAEYLALSPMTYTYYWIIKEMRDRGYKYLSWGVASEDFGSYLNMGLIANKESYGSTYGNYLTYHKTFN